MDHAQNFGWLQGVWFLVGVVISQVVTPVYRWMRQRSSGHFISNISVTLDITRAPSVKFPEKDDIVVLIKLSKLAVHAVRLEALRVEIFVLNASVFLEPIIGNNPDGKKTWKPNPENRSINASGELVSSREILAIWTTERKRPLNLAPGEGTQYSSYSVLPSDQAYEVIVTLRGTKYGSRRFFPHKLYWTASTVSIPVRSQET